MIFFLTGATGFLGSRTAEELTRRGHRVKALARRPKALTIPGVECIQGSLPDLPDLSPHLKDVDGIVHVAGVLKGLRERDFFDVNEEGTRRLAQAALSPGLNLKIFLHVSTVAVHDSGRDGDDFCLPPESCHPVSVYGKSKLAGEKTLSLLQGKIKTVILRPPVIYGPGDKELLTLFKAIRRGLAPVYGDGQNRLSVCHVKEVARALADLLEKPPAADEIFCLDDGETHTWKSLALQIGGAMKKNLLLLKIPPTLFALAAKASGAFAQITREPRIFDGEKLKEMRQASWVCGYQRLKKKTGWTPKVPFKEGVVETLDFYRREGWLS